MSNNVNIECIIKGKKSIEKYIEIVISNREIAGGWREAFVWKFTLQTGN